MADAAPSSEKIAAILRDLELPALRAKYLEVKEAGYADLLYFYTDPQDFAFDPTRQREQLLVARRLNEVPQIAMRFLELAAIGIQPRVVSYSEPGNAHLAVHVRYNERGRRTLDGSGLAVSEVIRAGRRYLWVGYYAIAIALLLFVFADRIARIGWAPTLVGLALVMAAIIFIRRMWR